MIVAPLTPEMFHPAYPLVRAAAPGISLAEWLRFARRATSPGRAKREGVAAARRAGQRFPSGLCCWRCDPDLAHGQILTAEHVIALDILDPAPVLDALLKELERVAARLHCGAVRSVVQPGAEALSARLLAVGLRPAASILSKPVEAP
jgi:hypothetical protein